jgi:aryl-alcohol dehydrogenase-like predicted oxidoreductase
MWERGVEEKVLPALRELGIGFVSYSPMGRGFLAGRITCVDDLLESDWRRNNPRFQGQNCVRNLKLVEIVKEISSGYAATPAQVALAWLLRQGDDIIPIPGTKHMNYLEENARAAEMHLPDSAWSALDKALLSFHAVGARYPEEAMRLIDNTD